VFHLQNLQKMCKLLYTVTSRNLLLKSLLYLLINTSNEANYYIVRCHSNNRKWRKQRGILCKIWIGLLPSLKPY